MGNIKKTETKQDITYAFIDTQNLNLGVQDLGWKIDWAKFRTYLKDKYKVGTAYLFMGYIDGNQSLYKKLQNSGYTIIFKRTLKLKNGKVKGNVDAELVLHTMIEKENFDKAVVVTGDGDFLCLIEHLIECAKLKALLVPNRKKWSSLFKIKTIDPFIRHVDDLQCKLEYKKKSPHKDGTL